MAKGAKKTASSGAKKTGGKKKGGRKGKRTWSRYVLKVLKNTHKELTASKKSVLIVNSFVSDLFDRIATQAAQVARVNGKSTLGSKEIQTAVKLLLPAELAKHAMTEGTKAVGKL